jgi:hypothetical protein
MKTETPRPAVAATGNGAISKYNSSSRYRPRSPSVQVNFRRQREVETICCTPRLVLELLCELGRHHGIVEDIDRRLARYAALDLDLLRAIDCDRFAASPLWIVVPGSEP